MTAGLTQAGANAIAAHIADTLFSGSTNVLEIIDASDTVLATASDLTLTDTNNVITVASAGGASVSTSGTAVGFNLKTSGGANTYYSFKNTNFTITPANQSTDDTFTSTAHELADGQPLIIGGSIPTTNPAVSDGDTVFVREATANTFKIERSPKAGAVDVTAVAASDTTFALPLFVGAAGSGAALILTSGVSLTSGETVTFSQFDIIIPPFAVGAA